MIRGYPARASVKPGELLALHVSTDAARFRVWFYRWWDGAELMSRSEWQSGRFAPARGADEDWHWPRYEFAIPLAWPSSAYIAYLEEEGGLPFDIALTSAAALFVVRGRGGADLLYEIPLATFHAYNYSGEGCFYRNPPRSRSPPGARVSLLRPGGDIGGETWGAADYYDERSARQTFAHWDAPFIRWLAGEGYRMDFCLDSDIHQDAGLLARGYRLLLSVGHDEYWSEDARNHVEDFIGSGGNAAFFAANVCWWRIHYVDEGRAIVCHQGGPYGALDHWWPVTGVSRPEDALAGVSYRHGGGWWDGPRSTQGYVVQQADHWVFAGTGLENGDVFGATSSPPLVGYECDGAQLACMDGSDGGIRLAAQAWRNGTSASFVVLAASILDEGWQELPARSGLAAREGMHAATMGIYARKGTVFTAGTIDWAQVLATGHDPVVERITRNVMERLRTL
ncbi:hypothetical protein CR152_06205 [Massilia violaceinigra]|uniref:N,N-dimethylformamidase beta subunit-like C-terminal domain-containing protein n=1 Tax=Massilia violaceinigra TaxID=2045208 RepID=A0A2D2DGN8_9BURK|nr:N,N-dimethylformamidase beta subunit family domain-containing protein [Massilia violaceinigra]ATQ74147.1 hypothetical protein CR152_06205 [Massilia violaceinigra]